MRTERLEESLLIYAFIICGTRGCKWGLSRRHPGRTPLLLLGELGQSPRPPNFGISIPRANRPPFAACHRKIGGSVPPLPKPRQLRQGPIFLLLCSMTP